MKINDSEIDAAPNDSRERLRLLEQRMRDKDPTLSSMAGSFAHTGRRSLNRSGALKEERPACIDDAVDAYLLRGQLPPDGTTCR